MRKLLNKAAVFTVGLVLLATVQGQIKQNESEKDCYTPEFKKIMQFCDEGYPVQCFFNSAIYYKDYENLQCLVDRGNSPNLPFVEADYHKIPVIYAASLADLKALQILSKLKIDWDVKDKTFGQTALLAVSYRTYLGLEVPRGSYYDTTKFLIERGANVNAKDIEGTTSLMIHSAQDRYESVKLLLENRADPNIRSNAGIVALMHASDNPQVIKSLLSAGADKTVKDKKGRSALFYAIEKCEPNKLSLLIVSKKDLNIVDNEGLTPLAFARRVSTQTKCPKVYDYLQAKAIIKQ